MDFYLFVSSKDSKEEFPLDTAGNFIIELPKEIILEGQWEVSICELGLYRLPKASDPRHIYICSPVVDLSRVDQFLYPILRRVPLKPQGTQIENYTTEHFYTVNHTRIQRLHIYAIDEKLSTKFFNKEAILDLTLHFRRKPLRVCS